MSDATWIGRSTRRVGGVERVTGTQRYAADLRLDNVLHVKLVTLPCARALINSVDTTKVANGQLEGGDVIAQEFDQLQPLFPNGAPKWYSQFSSEAQGLLNSAFKGDISVADALNQLADKATELAQSSS